VPPVVCAAQQESTAVRRETTATLGKEKAILQLRQEREYRHRVRRNCLPTDWRHASALDQFMSFRRPEAVN
jgi:hypothetical protein